MQPKDDKKIITLVVDSQIGITNKKMQQANIRTRKKNRNAKIYIWKFSKTPHF